MEILHQTKTTQFTDANKATINYEKCPKFINLIKIYECLLYPISSFESSDTRSKFFGFFFSYANPPCIRCSD